MGAEKHADTARQVFVRTWSRIFGTPEIVVVDPGAEVQGAFADNIQNHGVRRIPTDARAPRQNGRTERAGKEWEGQFRLAMHKQAPRDLAEYKAVGSYVAR